MSCEPAKFEVGGVVKVRNPCCGCATQGKVTARLYSEDRWWYNVKTADNAYVRMESELGK